MTSLADGLPPEVAAQLHPDWRTNEADYWQVRDGLLAEFDGVWVAFADGRIVSSGRSPVEVFRAAQDSGKHPFIVRVGAETEACRMRRTSFPYDAAYPGEPLPVISAEFRPAVGVPGTVLDRVIPDTGADASALPWSDCQAIGLSARQGTPGRIGGVGGSSAASLVFLIGVVLDGLEYPCRLQADFGGDERILGRDVLNRVEILFRGPAGEVVINP